MLQRFSCIVLVATIVSCSSTYHEKVGAAKRAYYAGDTTGAVEQMAQVLEDCPEGDAYHTCALLDQSIVSLAAGDAATAEANLRSVRDVLDDVERQETKALFSEIGTYLTDDRSKPYGGEDYEKIMIRVMLAFANLLRGGDDVIAYTNQVLEKQREILDQASPLPNETKWKSDYKMIGTGAYVYGLITEERDPTAGSEAKISYERVRNWEPRFRSIDKELDRVERGHYAQAGNGVLYVFAFVGKGPQKVEIHRNDVAVVSELSLQMLRFIPHLDRYGPTLDLSPIKVPAVHRDPTNSIVDVSVQIDGVESGKTETLTDVTATALQHHAKNRDWILTKAVLRRMVKKAVVTGLKGTGRTLTERGASRGTQNTAAVLFEIGGIVANTVWSAIERADTRFWSLLPDKIQVLRVEAPAGQHTVSLTPQLGGKGSGMQRSVDVSVVGGANTYVFWFVAAPEQAPAPLTNRPVEHVAGKVVRP